MKNGSVSGWILVVMAALLVVAGVWVSKFSTKQDAKNAIGSTEDRSSEQQENNFIKTVNGWDFSYQQLDSLSIEANLYIQDQVGKKMVGRVIIYGIREAFAVDVEHKTVVFLGFEKSSELGTKQGLLVYSIDKDQIINKIEWNTIASTLKITGHINANLNRLSVSPNGNSAAASFGYILEADYESRIVVFDLVSGLVKVIPQKGLVKGWKDDKTILYEVETAEKQEGSLYPKKAILEAKVD